MQRDNGTKSGNDLPGYATLFRGYDTEDGRWNQIDPKWRELPSESPYCGMGNNPVNMVDPWGDAGYLLIWFSATNQTGHAGIAIDNYKSEPIFDSKGNPYVDSKGNPITQMVKTGTMQYYDLWPFNPVGKTSLQSDVKADYSPGVEIQNLNGLKTKDPTVSRKGNVRPEGRPADGIIQITTTYRQDNKMKEYASKTVAANKEYNASNFDCSTFSESVLKTVFPKLDASQFLDIPISLQLLGYKDTRIVAPNNLYNSTLKLQDVEIIKGPKSVEAKPYLEYYGK